jgi:hypothetical protein
MGLQGAEAVAIGCLEGSGRLLVQTSGEEEANRTWRCPNAGKDGKPGSRVYPLKPCMKEPLAIKVPIGRSSKIMDVGIAPSRSAELKPTSFGAEALMDCTQSLQAQ